MRDDTTRRLNLERLPKVPVAGLVAATVALTAAVAIAHPYSSTEQNKWKKVEAYTNGAKRTFFKASTCQVKFISKEGNQWKRWEMDTRKMLVDSSYIRCKGGANCIKESQRSTASGAQWSSPVSRKHFPKNKVIPITTMSNRCTPGIKAAPPSTTWVYRAGDPTVGGSKTLSITGSKRFATDSELGNLGICKVIDWGAEYIGTMHNESTGKIWVHNGKKYVEKSLSGTRTVCTINHNDLKITSPGGNPPPLMLGRRYFNFQYLNGSISEAKWQDTTSTSGKRKIAKIDGQNVYLCMRLWHYTFQNGTTGQTMHKRRRGFGFRKPGDDTYCYTGRVQRSNHGVPSNATLAASKTFLLKN